MNNRFFPKIFLLITKIRKLVNINAGVTNWLFETFEFKIDYLYITYIYRIFNFKVRVLVDKTLFLKNEIN